jgi:hypothetical protein
LILHGRSVTDRLNDPTRWHAYEAQQLAGLMTLKRHTLKPEHEHLLALSQKFAAISLVPEND